MSDIVTLYDEADKLKDAGNLEEAVAIRVAIECRSTRAVHTKLVSSIAIEIADNDRVG